MSDGPHRTLRMRLGWKTFAKLADNGAYASEEVASAANTALAQDWYGEVPVQITSAICQIFTDNQECLFDDQRSNQISALSVRASGHELGQLFVDCAIQVAVSGGFGPEAAVQAAENALSIWGSRHARQVEEHYCREAGARRAFNVRARVESALGSVSHAGLARRLLNMDATPIPRNMPRLTGLDEGVRF